MDMSIAATGFAPDPPLREAPDPGDLSSYYRLRFGSSSIAASSDDWERVALIELVRRLCGQESEFPESHSWSISPATAATAERFFAVLPTRKALPRISPDGEGGLMMVWESPTDHLLVTVDGCLLQVVFAAATPRACYLNDLPFEGAELPRNLLAAIPDR